MKKKAIIAFGLVAILLIIDQLIKVWIKTSFYSHETLTLFGTEPRPWGELFFVENEGMAWGWMLPGKWGKLFLSGFRIVAVIFLFRLLYQLVKRNASYLLLICVGLILAGATGNVIDGMFYGLIFSESPHYSEAGTNVVADFVPFGQGYAPFLFGKVVDMFHFPFIENGRWTSFIPSLEGEYLEIPFLVKKGRFVIGDSSVDFFGAIFNFADAAISVAVGLIIFFQKSLIKSYNEAMGKSEDEAAETPNVSLEKEANSLVKKFKKNGITLDYSIDSLSHVEKYISGSPLSKIKEENKQLGGYLGEVIRKKHSTFSWIETNNIFTLSHKKLGNFSPIRKVESFIRGEKAENLQDFVIGIGEMIELTSDDDTTNESQ